MGCHASVTALAQSDAFKQCNRSHIYLRYAEVPLRTVKAKKEQKRKEKRRKEKCTLSSDHNRSYDHWP